MSPPKRRQLSTDEGLQAWKSVFLHGRDYFAYEGDPAYKYSKLEAAQAWRRLGRRYLDELWPLYQRNNPKDTREQPWALEQFGEPE